MIILIDEIDKLFSTYGYRVRCFFNKNKDEILWIVGYYSRKIDSGSLICFISSHGYQTSLACPNGDYVQIFDILKMAKTKELDKRPKVFFFDACRKYCYTSNRFDNITTKIFDLSNYLLICYDKAYWVFYCHYTLQCLLALYITGTHTFTLERRVKYD